MTLAVRGSTWDPFAKLVRQFDDFDEIVRSAFSAPRRVGTGFVPAANLDRDGSDVVITLELPGIDTDQLSVEVSDGRLRISGQRSDERSGEREGTVYREITSGQFRREFALPEHVDADAVEADYADGLLKVRVRDVVKPTPQPRTIEVRRADQRQVAADADDNRE